MKTVKDRLATAVLFMAVMAAVSFLMCSNGRLSAQSDIPEGLIMQKTYEPGPGASVGKILLVQGRVVLMHSDKLRGYLAKKDLPVFKGDTIVTSRRGRVRFKLDDGSVLSMASATTMVINRSIYDPEKKNRASFVSMGEGKARFFIRKLSSFKKSEFKVKTKTAILGVRGSDFIVRSTEKSTEVTALKNTVLEIVSIANLEESPVVITDFERTVVDEGELPSEIFKVTIDEIKQMMMDVEIVPVQVEPVARADVSAQHDTRKGSEAGDRRRVSDGSPGNEVTRRDDTTGTEVKDKQQMETGLKPGTEADQPRQAPEKPQDGGQSSHDPNASGAAPGQPQYDPNAPGAAPGQPQYDPNAPEAAPGQPQYDPNVPKMQPGKLANKPFRPVFRPDGGEVGEPKFDPGTAGFVDPGANGLPIEPEASEFKPEDPDFQGSMVVAPAVPMEDYQAIINQEGLEQPVIIDPDIGIGEPLVPEIIYENEVIRQQDDITQQQEDIVTEKHEQTIEKVLEMIGLPPPPRE